MEGGGKGGKFDEDKMYGTDGSSSDGLKASAIYTHASCRQTEQSSQLDEPLWTDPGTKSGISVRELVSTSKQTNKQTKRAQAGNEW